MKSRSLSLAGLSLALALAAQGALAQGAAAGTAPGPGTAPPGLAPAGPVGATDKKAMSQACSAKADQQGLHGKARKKFRSACKAGKA